MIIPADVPQSMQTTFQENYNAITQGTNKCLLFAGDQKIEHLNPINAEKLFKLAQEIPVGAFATHFGLIARYAHTYKNINYIAKLNAKTNFVGTEQADPISLQLWDIDDIANTNLPIRGVGYTIYLGSEHEAQMLQEAAQIVYQAHQRGLVTILWIYPRGKAVTEGTSIESIAGAVGVANSLGSDFVKIKSPHSGLETVIQSAGNTAVLCAGGPKQKPEDFLQEVSTQLQAGAAGSAVGRNIYQHDFNQACNIAKATAALIYENKSLEEALKMIK